LVKFSWSEIKADISEEGVESIVILDLLDNPIQKIKGTMSTNEERKLKIQNEVMP